MKLLIALLFVLPMTEAVGSDEAEIAKNMALRARDLDKTFKDPQLLKTYVKKDNDRRMDVAKWRNISNMHELTWDEGLAKSAESYGKNCPNVHEHGSNYRQWNTAEQNSVSMLDLLEKKATEGSYLDFFESKVPTQTKYGCAVNKCDHFICNFGPHSDWKYSDFKEGLPGTGCPGGKTKEGLCNGSTPPTPAPKPTTETPTTTTEPPSPTPIMTNSSASATPAILAGISLALLF